MAEAEAERFKVEALAEAEANKTRLTGQAQAEAILARGAAEAEAKQKIADAFKEYGEAAVLSMVMEMLPQLMKEAAQPLGNIDKISVVDTGAVAKILAPTVLPIMQQTCWSVHKKH